MVRPQLLGQTILTSINITRTTSHWHFLEGKGHTQSMAMVGSRWQYNWSSRQKLLHESRHVTWGELSLWPFAETRPSNFYYISLLVRALWLVNFAGRILLYCALFLKQLRGGRISLALVPVWSQISSCKLQVYLFNGRDYFSCLR